MTDIPIIFSAPMIRALLDGKKTMTRRLAWSKHKYSSEVPGKPSPWQRVKHGDRLWVKENCVIAPARWTSTPINPRGPERRETAYLADNKTGEISDAARDYGLKTTSSIFMPRWASRLTLIVTATKIERVQEISEEDAIAEGVKKIRDHCYVVEGFDYDLAGLCHSRAVIPFAKLWEHLHGNESWDANHEVVALTFTVHRCNIDQLKAEAA